MTREEWMTIAFQENNPGRDTRWTGLYFDPTARNWMVSCETPVDWQGRHLVTIGHDILLQELFERVFNDRIEGAYNFILRKDGRVIAHPDKRAEPLPNIDNRTISAMVLQAETRGWLRS